MEGGTVSSHAFTDFHYPDKCGESSGLLLPRPGIHCWTILSPHISPIGVGSYTLTVRNLFRAIRPRNGIRWNGNRDLYQKDRPLQRFYYDGSAIQTLGTGLIYNLPNIRELGKVIVHLILAGFGGGPNF